MANKDPIDIGAAFSYATSDPDWMSKMAIAGLHMLIPIVGIVALFGWTRDIFLRVRAGEEGLPKMELGKHMELGWAPIVAILNISLLALVIVVPIMGSAVLLIAAEETGSEALEVLAVLAMLLSQVFTMIFALGINFLAPEIWRRGFHGEMGPLFSFGQSWRNVKGNLMPCFLVVVGFFVAQMAGSVGVMLCYVGMFLTLPFSYVVMAHLVAQWDALVNPEGAPEKPDDDEWEVAQKA